MRRMVVGIDPRGIEMETLLQLLKGRPEGGSNKGSGWARGGRKKRTGVETPAQRQNRMQQEIREAEERARRAGGQSIEEEPRPKSARVGVLTPEQQALRESPLTPEQQALANKPVVFNPIVSGRRALGRQRAGRVGVTAPPPRPVDEVEQVAEEQEPITGLQPFVNQKDPTWLNRFKEWFT